MRYLARGEIPGCFLSTFNIPNLANGRVPLGTTAEGGGYQPGQLPNISGFVAVASMVNKSQTTSLNNLNVGGCFVSSSASKLKIGDGDTTNASWFSEGTIEFKASNSSSIYGAYTAVVPSGVYTKYIIKY